MLVVARTSVRASNSSPGLVNSSNNSTYVLVCHTVLRQQSNNTPTQGTPWGLPPPSSPPSSSCWRLCPVRRPARPGRTWGTTPAAKFSLSPAVAWLKITLTFLPHVSRDNCLRMFLTLLFPELQDWCETFHHRDGKPGLTFRPPTLGSLSFLFGVIP